MSASSAGGAQMKSNKMTMKKKAHQLIKQ